MSSRDVSTMLKQGFISDPTLSFSPSRTQPTSLSKPYPKSPSPPPYSESTRPSQPPNPTLFEMMSEEHNRESKTLEDSHKKSQSQTQILSRSQSQARVAKMLTEFNDGVVSTSGLGAGDVRLTVAGREGYKVSMDVHRRVLAEKSRFFKEKMNQRRGLGVSHMVEISECDDVEVYVEAVVLMYYDDLKSRLIGEDVIKVLALLKVSSAIMFDALIMSCLEYLEAVPWPEDYEDYVVACLSELDLPGSASEILKRVLSEPSVSTRSDEILSKLLSGVLQAKDEKSRREMKTLISRLLREEATNGHNDLTASKETLYVFSHRCLSALVLCLSDATSRINETSIDRGVLMAEIGREADNLSWIVEILIDRKICESFVKLWADQTELAALHSRIPVMYRHEISKITAQLCVAIGKGRVLVPRDTRNALLTTWLEGLYEDFGWMKRTSRTLDRKVIEDGLSRTVLTLSLSQQQVILLKWFDRFLAKGDDCPNIRRAFEVWWRRAFVRQCAAEQHESRLQITVCDYPIE